MVPKHLLTRYLEEFGRLGLRLFKPHDKHHDTTKITDIWNATSLFEDNLLSFQSFMEGRSGGFGVVKVFPFPTKNHGKNGTQVDPYLIKRKKSNKI